MERSHSPTANSATHALLAERIAERARATKGALIVGVCGAQGSGKSTITPIMQRLLEGRGLRTALLSLDDLYLTRNDRERAAREIHPLLKTRGVPGTHDVALGIEVLAALREENTVMMPAFDKATDDRLPRSQWPCVSGKVNVVLFEGWCVGAVPQREEALREPVNALERLEDPDGSWRRHVNEALAGEYRQLFGQIGCLVLLAAPDFEVVYRWRLEQEESLRQTVAATGRCATGLMSEAELRWFISHYERLTRHILTEMPSRADVVVRLDPQRRMTVETSGARLRR